MEKQTDPNVLHDSILNHFQSIRVSEPLPYERLVAQIDQKCNGLMCDRSVIRELFSQCCSRYNTASLEAVVDKYIQNLNTCRLCLDRENIKLEQCLKRQELLESSRKNTLFTPYAFLEVVRAKIHPHFSSSPIFSYKIEPTDLPPVTLINDTNPTINDSYTLELPDRYFEIVFMESGIQIARWRFDAINRVSGKVYDEHIEERGLEVQIRVKYYDRGQEMSKEIENCQKEMIEVESRKDNAEKAYAKLLQFEPFHRISKPHPKYEQPAKDESALFKLTSILLKILPFFQKHVRNCYYFSILVVVAQSLASIYSPAPMINMILPMYIFGLVHMQGQHISQKLWMSVMVQTLMIANNVFILFLNPQPFPPQNLRSLLIIATFVQSIYWLLLSITAVRNCEFTKQAGELLGYPAILPS